MGVKGLWKMISSCGKQSVPHDLTLAIDTSIWIHQYKGMQEQDAIFYISKKIIKLLYHNISPVFIFDGPASILKRKVLEERKVEKLDSLVKDIVENAICKKCKIKIRICKHGGIKRDDFKCITEDVNKEWGEFNIETKSKDLSSFSDIKDIMNSDEYSFKQKLKMLVKLRERRKNKLEINDSSMTNFSLSQIKNIRNRNMVSYYIKKLEDASCKRIQSDCKKSFILKKETKNETREFDSSDEINDFLEIKNEEEDFLKNKEEEIILKNKEEDLLKNNWNIKKEKNPFDKIVTCKINTENINDGFFGSNKFIEQDTENKIIYNFESKEIKMNYFNSIQKNETMDFLSIQSIIKEILKVSNLPFLDSPSESDAQCAYLCKEKIVEGVITEDNDILLHGGIVYKNFFRKNKNIMRFDPAEIENKMGISTEDLCKIGYILGSDYTLGIKGIGMKKALDYLKSEDFLKLDIESYMNIYKKPKINEDWRPKFGLLDINRLKKYWIKNNIDIERIDELLFYLKSKYKDKI